jgi:hypothetical protein
MNQRWPEVIVHEYPMHQCEYRRWIYPSLQRFPFGSEFFNHGLIAGERQRYKNSERYPPGPNTEQPKLIQHSLQATHIDNVKQSMNGSVAKCRHA